MKAIISAVVIALGLTSAAAFAAGNSGDATVDNTTINNTASARNAKAEVDIGSAFGGGGGFLGLGSTSNKGKATVTNSTINNTASARNAEARVRIGSAY